MKRKLQLRLQSKEIISTLHYHYGKVDTEYPTTKNYEMQSQTFSAVVGLKQLFFG